MEKRSAAHVHEPVYDTGDDYEAMGQAISALNQYRRRDQ